MKNSKYLILFLVSYGYCILDIILTYKGLSLGWTEGNIVFRTMINILGFYQACIINLVIRGLLIFLLMIISQKIFENNKSSKLLKNLVNFIWIFFIFFMNSVCFMWIGIISVLRVL